MFGDKWGKQPSNHKASQKPSFDSKFTFPSVSAGNACRNIHSSSPRVSQRNDGDKNKLKVMRGRAPARIFAHAALCPPRLAPIGLWGWVRLGSARLGSARIGQSLSMSPSLSPSLSSLSFRLSVVLSFSFSVFLTYFVYHYNGVMGCRFHIIF